MRERHGIRVTDLGKKKEEKEFLGGIFWNYGSLVIMSASGFLFNCLIIFFYDASILGRFNKAYAWYCVLSQVAVWGLHMSVLQKIPETKKNERECKEQAASAMLGGGIISVLAVFLAEGILYLCMDHTALFYEDIRLILLGLPFFSFNKILLNYLNGLSRMKAYAVFQSLRYFFIAAAILVMGLLKVEGRFLTCAFTFAEALLLFIMLIYLNGIRMLGGKVKQEYLLAHIRFGTKILPANMVVELNTKVDIICLGFLVKNDSVIGIYSFAILFAEGFYQIYIVIRRSINPKLTEAYAGRRLEEEFTSLDKGLKKCFKWLSPFLMMAVTGFYCVVCLVLGREYFEGTKYLIVICAAMAINGRNIVYGNIFSQLGLPIIESGINVITVFSNFVMNLCFILLCGTMGAAAATAVSHCIYGRLIKKSINRKCGLFY